MKTSRVGRIVRILTTLQSGQKYSVKELEDILGISRRTVFRDLKELSSIGVPYKYSSKEGGYSIDPEFFLPPLDFNLSEALSLLMLIHKGRHHLPLPFKNSVLLAGLKIENQLPDDIRKYCSATLSKISIAKERCADYDMLDNVFPALQQAVTKKRKVEMVYESFSDRGRIETVLCPYHIFYRNRGWYVVGKSCKHKEIRMFNLARIADIKMQDKCFIEGDDFDLAEYLGRAWQLIPEGKLYNIKSVLSHYKSNRDSWL